LEKFPSDSWPCLELLGKPIGELRYRRVSYRKKLLDVTVSNSDAVGQAVHAVVVIRDDVDVTRSASPSTGMFGLVLTKQ
jgi:hypothetical protein